MGEIYRTQQMTQDQEDVAAGPVETPNSPPSREVELAAETSAIITSSPFLEVEPDSLAEIQAIAGRLPQRNVIQLEINLQREHGPYQSWDHDLVLEWVRLRQFEHSVRNFFVGYHIDGEAITSLDMTALSSKYSVTDFRTKAKIMQAVEYLRHSARSNVSLQDPTVLPAYQE
ncbi:hypothetical protein HDU76_009738 [Blyttiomyces sp. JEL0837]|nr:hypothetical protein HDU76_009738 [Blyttiomyces sp. JEL0837]